MAERNGDGWWDGTWNPVGGCKPVGPGCLNCYAAELAATQQTAHQIPLYHKTTEWRRGRPVFNGRLTALEAGRDGWWWPLKWRGAARPWLGPGQPSLIFVVDMGDLFADRPTPVIDRVVDTIIVSRHIGQLCTRRPRRMAEYFSTPRPDAWRQKLWLGFSAERQQEFDAGWAAMRELAASGWLVFVSISPMLAPVRLPEDFLQYGDRVWAICSGEEKRRFEPRPMDPNWARALRDQCAAAGVPFFLLQMAGRKPIPADLLPVVRQFPRARP